MARNASATREKKADRSQTVAAVIGKLRKVLGAKGLKQNAIRSTPEAPLYRADPDDPSFIFRTLRGVEERGRVDARGRFRAVSAR